MSVVSNETALPFWVEPPLDAWEQHRGKLITLFIYYIICIVIGESVNWLCLLNINKTSLNQSARYLMLTQVVMNTAYITINIPYKAAILYLQRTFLPYPLKIFCGWLHVMVVFGSMFLQDVMAVTRVLYIVFPIRAASWLNSKAKCAALPLIPVAFGLLYAGPTLHPCCYRFYKFISYAMSYVGPQKQVQLGVSLAGSLVLAFTLITSYTWIILAIRGEKRKQAQKMEQRGRKNLYGGSRNEKKERKLAALFGVTGAVWLTYLTMFYVIYWSGLFKAYSVLLLANEMLEQFLFFMDPIVYIMMSSDLRKTVLNVLGIHSNSVEPLSTNMPTRGRTTGTGSRREAFTRSRQI